MAATVALFLTFQKESKTVPQQSIEEQVKAIDQSIDTFSKEIEQHRIDAFNAEMEAQNLLPVKWEEYAKKIEEVENKEDQITEIEKRIDELKVEKQTLLKSKMTPEKRT